MANFIDRFIGYVSPERACRREAFRMELTTMRRGLGYDAGGHGRLNANWRAFNESAELTDRVSRDVVRARARDLERNSDMENGVLIAFRRNVVGRGFTLQPKTGDPDLDKQIGHLWKRWCKAKNCDVTGQQSFTQLLRMAVERKKVDGGILFKKCYTTGGLLPFKLQALEVDELAQTVSAPHNKNDRVVGGIEYNQYNRPIGYWIEQYSIDGYSITQPLYYPAKDMIFYYTKRRPSQLREFSDLSPTITRIRDANEYITAVSIKERIAACLAVFIKKNVPTTGFGRNGQARAETPASYQGKTISPGMIQEMNAGDEIQVVDPKGESANASEFLQMQQRLIGSGQGLSYEATSRDMKKTTYSSARQGSIEDDLTYGEEIELLQTSVMDETYETFLISAVLAGALAIPDFWEKKDTYMEHEWVAGAKRWVDPQKEAGANQIALTSGQKTFKQISAEQGRDWKDQIDDMADVAEYAAEKGVVLGGVTANGSQTANPTVPAEPPEPEPSFEGDDGSNSDGDDEQQLPDEE